MEVYCAERRTRYPIRHRAAKCRWRKRLHIKKLNHVLLLLKTRRWPQFKNYEYHTWLAFHWLDYHSVNDVLSSKWAWPQDHYYLQRLDTSLFIRRQGISYCSTVLDYAYFWRFCCLLHRTLLLLLNSVSLNLQSFLNSSSIFFWSIWLYEYPSIRHKSREVLFQHPLPYGVFSLAQTICDHMDKTLFTIPNGLSTPCIIYRVNTFFFSTTSTSSLHLLHVNNIFILKGKGKQSPLFTPSDLMSVTDEVLSFSCTCVSHLTWINRPWSGM